MMAASAPPINSLITYGTTWKMWPEPKLDTAIPQETAGLRDPPETAPIAYPPAVTHEAIAKANTLGLN